MASSRLTGTNENVSTYDSAGGKDYSTLHDWENATDYDLVSDTTSEVLECYAGAHNDYGLLSGATTNSSYFRIIRPASGEGHSGIPKSDGSCVEFHRVNWSYVFRIWQEEYVNVQDLVLKLSENDNNLAHAVYLDNGSYGRIIGCLIYNCTNAYSGYSANGITIEASSTAYAYVYNCLIHNCDGVGCYNTGSSLPRYYNCTVTNCATGFQHDSYTHADNIVSSNNTTFHTGTSTFSQVTNYNGTSVVFEDAANDDFHLASSDTVAKNQGTNRSSYFTDDIDGETRSGTWDIGFDENLISAITKAFTETLGLGDTNARRNVANRFVNETVSVVYTTIRRMLGIWSSSEQAAISEQDDRRAYSNRLINETESISDVNTKRAWSIRALNETVSIVKNVIRRMFSTRASTESVSITETLARVGAIIKAAANEVISITSTALELTLTFLVKVFNETIALLDTGSRASILVKILNDTVSILETGYKKLAEYVSTPVKILKAMLARFSFVALDDTVYAVKAYKINDYQNTALVGDLTVDVIKQDFSFKAPAQTYNFSALYRPSGVSA